MTYNDILSFLSLSCLYLSHHLHHLYPARTQTLPKIYLGSNSCLDRLTQCCRRLPDAGLPLTPISGTVAVLLAVNVNIAVERTQCLRVLFVRPVRRQTSHPLRYLLPASYVPLSRNFFFSNYHVLCTR